MAPRACPAGRDGIAADELDLNRLAAGRLWAVNRLPYFAAALFSLRPVNRPGLGTFAVDCSWRLYVDPATVARWSVPEIGSVLVHEVLHLLRDHAGRARTLGLTPDLDAAWNLACDAEINDDLVDAGLPLPHPVLPAHLHAPTGCLAEYYLQKAKRRRRRSDCGGGVDGRRRPSDEPEQGATVDGVGQLQVEVVRHQVATEVMAAHVSQPGSVPAGLIRWAEGHLRPRVDWRRELGSLIRKADAQVSGQVDYTFARRSRRAAAIPGVILPGLSRPVPDVAIVVDTSASMGTSRLERCLAEVDGIISSVGLRSRRAHVLAVDTEVQAAGRPARARDVRLRGGGGTDMGAGLEAAGSLRPRPRLVLVLTDGDTPWPEAPPARMTIVVALLVGPDREPDRPPPWARTVVIGDAA